MDNIIYFLFVSLSVPLLLMVMLVERRARLPLIFFLVGMFVSVFISEVNGLLFRLTDMDMLDFTLRVTPVTEEIIKALPILFYAVTVSDKKETLFTISMATGVGFAVLENAYVLLGNADNLSLLTAIIRGFGTGLMHGICSLLVGYGISFVKKRRKLFAPGTFALLSLAVTYHAIFNMLIQSQLKLVGALIPILTYLPIFFLRNFRKDSPSNSKKERVRQ